MAGKQQYELGDDQPKQNPWQDDLLGNAPFAKMLFNVIRDLRAPNGYVIGIQGQWGSGKTTVINFLKAYLDKYNEELEDQRERIAFIEFRPWIVAGHQDLVASFFKVLTEILGIRDSWLARRGKDVLRFLRGPSDTLVNSLATVGMTVDPTKVGAGFASAMAKKSINRMIGRFVEEPSLQQAYEKLKEQLGKEGKRLVVVIDDLDRLEDHEVRTIMQMVKTVGRLPNVIYMLSYDRVIVGHALDAKKISSGPRYAEKIVQQEIELPRPDKRKLLKILDREIEFLLAGGEDTARWQYLLRDGLHRWITSPRDVVKLSNAVKFAWPTFKDELDAQDLLVVEGLKLFDEAAFNWVRDNREFLFSEGRFMLNGDDAKAAAVENLKRRYEDDGRLQQVLKVLSVLFPSSAKWIEGSEIGIEPYEEVMKRRGIGSKDGYETYFRWGVSEDAIPKSAIDTLVANLDDGEAIRGVFEGYLLRRNSQGEPMIVPLFEEVRIRYRGQNPARPTQALLHALFEIGERVISIDWEPTFLSLGPRAQIRFLIRNMLEVWGKEKAGECLIDAFEKAGSAAFCASVYVDIGRTLGVFPSDPGEQSIIEMDHFDKLGPLLLSKITAAADDETLKSAPFYFDIADAWAHLADSREVKSWLTARIQEGPEFMSRAVRGLVSYTIGTAVRTYTMRGDPEEQLFDVAVLAFAGRKHLEGAVMNDDERRLLQAVVDRSERILAERSSVSHDDRDEAK